MNADEDRIRQAWGNRKVNAGTPFGWGYDSRGNKIKRSDYGNADSQFGWVVQPGSHAPIHWREAERMLGVPVDTALSS